MSQHTTLKFLYELLKIEAPEAAIGVGAVGIALLLLTASAVVRDGPFQDVLFWGGVAFIAVGVLGFLAAIIVAAISRSRK
jgi:hypothetical protein